MGSYEIVINDPISKNWTFTQKDRISEMMLILTLTSLIKKNHHDGQIFKIYRYQSRQDNTLSA